MLFVGRDGLGSGVLRIALLNTRGPSGSGPSGPRRYRIAHRGGRCNRALLRPHIDGNDSRRCRVVRRVVAYCR